MHFEKNNIYHIYNRGNNSQRIFFSKRNYLFFLSKINTYITPFADILAWCLMPNHFHLMIYTKRISIKILETKNSNLQYLKTRRFNDSIAILLRSYTRAINKQETRTGSLFQNRTKAICLTDHSGVTPGWFNTNSGTQINVDDPSETHLQRCFNYIHMNPVSAGLTIRQEDWEFSSYSDYLGIRKGKLINRERARELGLALNR